jgi:hypothetical protein
MSKIAGILGVSVSWLLMGHGESPNGTAEIGRIRGDLDRVRRSLTEALVELDATAARLDGLEELDD